MYYKYIILKYYLDTYIKLRLLRKNLPTNNLLVINKRSIEILKSRLTLKIIR